MIETIGAIELIGAVMLLLGFACAMSVLPGLLDERGASKGSSRRMTLSLILMLTGAAIFPMGII